MEIIIYIAICLIPLIWITSWLKSINTSVQETKTEIMKMNALLEKQMVTKTPSIEDKYPD